MIEWRSQHHESRERSQLYDGIEGVSRATCGCFSRALSGPHCQQLDERCSRFPARGRMTHGRRIEIEESDENIADDASADWSESVAIAPDIGLTQDVVPQRCLTRPSCLRGADLVGTQWLDVQKSCDGFAGWKSDTLSSLEI